LEKSPDALLKIGGLTAGLTHHIVNTMIKVIFFIFLRNVQ